MKSPWPSVRTIVRRNRGAACPEYVVLLTMVLIGVLGLVPALGGILQSLATKAVSCMLRAQDTAPKNNSINMKALKAQLERHEGNRSKVYNDTAGHPTIGIGFNLDRGGARKEIEALGLDFEKVKNGTLALSAAQIKSLFNVDVARAVADARKIVSNFDDLPEEKKRVVIDMIFNLGPAGFTRFRDMINALEAKDYGKAADAMVDSAWYKQVGDRSRRLVAMMRKAPATDPKRKPQRAR